MSAPRHPTRGHLGHAAKKGRFRVTSVILTRGVPGQNRGKIGKKILFFLTPPTNRPVQRWCPFGGHVHHRSSRGPHGSRNCNLWVLGPNWAQLGPNLIKHKTIDIDIDALLRACARSM